MKCPVNVVRFNHITVTEKENLLLARDVINIHTVYNVWFNVCKIQGKWRFPCNVDGGNSIKVVHSIQLS